MSRQGDAVGEAVTAMTDGNWGNAFTRSARGPPRRRWHRRPVDGQDQFGRCRYAPATALPTCRSSASKGRFTCTISPPSPSSRSLHPTPGGARGCPLGTVTLRLSRSPAGTRRTTQGCVGEPVRPRRPGAPPVRRGHRHRCPAQADAHVAAIRALHSRRMRTMPRPLSTSPDALDPFEKFEEFGEKA